MKHLLTTIPTRNEVVGFLKHVRFVIKSPLLVLRIANGFWRTHFYKESVLRSVELAITFRCQATCAFCYSESLVDQKRQPLSLEEIREVWRQCLKAGAIHVNLTGGEPMIRKDWPEIIAACTPHKAIVSMVTNGDLLTEENVKRAKRAGLTYLQVSLDSANPIEHDRSRGIKGLFGRAVRGIELAKKYGITVSLSCVVTNENAPTREIWDLIELAKKLNVFLLLNLAAMAGRWQSNRAAVLTPKTRGLVQEFRKDSHVRQNVMYNFRMREGCPAATEKIYITAYGDVTPCPLTHVSYGNIRKTPLAEILKRMRAVKDYSSFPVKCLRCEDQSYYQRVISPLAEMFAKGVQMPVPVEDHPLLR